MTADTHLTQFDFKLDVSIDATQHVTLEQADLAEIRRHAEKQNLLYDDHFLLDELNQFVEAKLDMFMWDWWDFDWSGAKQSDLFEAIRSTDPAPIPEIPGQISIDDILTDKT